MEFARKPQGLLGMEYHAISAKLSNIVWSQRRPPPGVMCKLQHVIHNAGRDMLGACTHLAGHVPAVSAVAKMLRLPAMRARLEATCFTSDVGVALRRSLKGVRTVVYDKRWNTFAMACKDILARNGTLICGMTSTPWIKKFVSENGGSASIRFEIFMMASSTLPKHLWISRSMSFVGT